MSRICVTVRRYLRGSGPGVGFQFATASAVSASLFLLTIRAVFRHLTDEQADGHVLNVTGRQRMLAQRVAREAFAFGTGDLQARARAEAVTAEFGRSLAGLLHGNTAMRLPPSTAVARPYLLSALDEWRPLAAAISRLPATPDGSRLAVEDVAGRADRLTDLAHEAVVALDDAFSQKVRRLRQQVVLLASGGPVLLAMTYVALLAHARTRAARAEAEVAEKERALQDLANRRRALVERLLSISEEERRRAASDLHDGPAQELMAAAMLLDTLDPGAEGSSEQVAMVQGHLNSAVRDIRELIAGWRPPLLDDFGIGQALERALRPVAAARGAVLEIDVSALGARPDPQTELTLYRTAYVAVVHAIRHSNAKRVTVSVSAATEAPNYIELMVSDDGIGSGRSDVAATDDHPSLEFFEMQERLELLGGDLAVRSEVGLGTRVAATVPRRR